LQGGVTSVSVRKPEEIKKQTLPTNKMMLSENQVKERHEVRRSHEREEEGDKHRVSASPNGGAEQESKPVKRRRKAWPRLPPEDKIQ